MDDSLDCRDREAEAWCGADGYERHHLGPTLPGGHDDAGCCPDSAPQNRLAEQQEGELGLDIESGPHRQVADALNVFTVPIETILIGRRPF